MPPAPGGKDWDRLYRPWKRPFLLGLSLATVCLFAEPHAGRIYYVGVGSVIWVSFVSLNLATEP